LARCALLLNLTFLFLNLPGCNYEKDYSYLQKDIPEVIRNVCKKEYKMDVTSKMIGETTWIYVPLEDIFAAADKKKKPEKTIERFTIEDTKSEIADKTLKTDYLVKLVPEAEKAQSVVLSKDFYLKSQYIWQVMYRIIFSIKPQKSGGLQFFSVVFADIKNGFVIRNIYYYLDIKKAMYSLISQTELQHRVIQDWQVAPEVIGDKSGITVNYINFTMNEFISQQILNRIRIKFQKPEVERNADIDKEIEKIIAYTVKVYDFKDFDNVELNNLLTNKKLILNRAAILAKPIE
jgi:hypothetical protein